MGTPVIASPMFARPTIKLATATLMRPRAPSIMPLAKRPSSQPKRFISAANAGKSQRLSTHGMTHAKPSSSKNAAT
jgi:hypothetical protein